MFVRRVVVSAVSGVVAVGAVTVALAGLPSEQPKPGRLDEVEVSVCDQYGFVVESGPFSLEGRRPMVELACRVR